MYFLLVINTDLMGGGSAYSFVSSHNSLEDAMKKKEAMSLDMSNTRSIYSGWEPKYVVTQRVY